MKKTRRIIISLALSAVTVLSPAAAMAGETAAVSAVKVERTKMSDSIKSTLGGVPESVRKIEYAGSIFYLAGDVTDADFLTVLTAGPEAVRMKTPGDSGRLYKYPVYILWSGDRTALLAHPIIYDYDMVLEAVSVPADIPAALTGFELPVVPASAPLQMSEDELRYMLSAEYADAVRTEFYRLLNEHRAAHGLRELEVNTELQGYADIRAGEQRALFGHTRPDGTPAGSGWHKSWNVINSRYAENALATGALDADPVSAARGVFSIWKDSEGHNRHMLYDFKPETTMALGIAPELDDTGFVTSGAIFATGF
jgi:hypothetical protein